MIQPTDMKSADLVRPVSGSGRKRAENANELEPTTRTQYLTGRFCYNGWVYECSV